MPQEDLFGRVQTVEYAMSDLAPALMEAVTTVVDNITPAADERTENLIASVDSVAQALGEQREHDEEVARQWVDSVLAMREELANANRTQQRSHGVFERATDYLRNIATAIRGGFNRGSGEQWVAISRLSAEAQRNIADAIRMSDCCGKATQVITAASTQVTTSDFMGGNPAQQQVLVQDIGQAVSQALGGRGAGYPGGPGGGSPGGPGGGSPGGPGGGSPGGPGGPGAGGPPGGTAAAIAGAQKWNATLNVVAATLTMIGRTLGDLLEVRLEQIWPSAKAENRFRLAMREAVFLTRGFGKYNRELEVSYRDITNEVMASGVFRNEFQTVWMQNLERGLKVSTDLEKEAVKKLKVDGKQLRLDQQEQKLRDNQVKQMKATTATALNTAKMLSMDMGVVNEQFMDWHMQLGMSASDVAEIGRNMRTIAMDSGVYGKNMEKVMKDVDELGKALKASGNLTADGMSRAMAIMARAEQQGVSDITKTILKAGTNFSALMKDASPEIAHLIISSARMAEDELGHKGLVNRIMFGGLHKSAKDVDAWAEGFKKRMLVGLEQQKDLLASVGIDVKELDPAKLEAYAQRLDDAANEAEKKGNLGLASQYRKVVQIAHSVTKDATGVELGEASRIYTSFKEGAKTAQMQLQELGTQIDKIKKAGGSGKVLNEKMAQKLKVETDAYLNMFSTISAKAAGAGGILDESARKFAQTSISENIGEDFGKQVANMEGAAESLMNNISKQATDAGKNLNNMLSARGFSVADIKKQLASGEKVQIDGAREVLDSVMQELGIKQKTGEDAMTELTESIRTLNATLGEKLGGGLDLLANNPLLAKLVPVGSEIAKWLGIFVGGGSKILRGLLGGGGGGAAAGRAAGTAGNFVDDLVTAGRGFVDDAARAGRGFAGNVRQAGTTLKGLWARALGKTLSIGGVVVSGIFGGEEAKAAGKEFAQGAGFGALTGGAGTGSMLSPMLGVEKGGAVDKGLGVAGATAYGAAAGAAIGAAFFGAGAAPGAAIGAAVGALFEVLKILGEKFQWIADITGIVINPLGAIVELIWNMIKGVWDIIAGIFTLDLGRIGEGIKKILWDGLVVGLSKAFWSFHAGVIKAFTWALQGIINGLLSIPKWIKNVFIDLPKWLYNTILEGLSSLASNEWIGPIIEPFKILWETIGELFSTIWAPVEAVFTALSDALDPVIKAVSSFFDSIRSFFGIEKAADGASGVLAFLASTLKVVAQVVGFVIKMALTPLIWTIKAITAVVSTPDLVMGIIKWFAKLPILIPMYLLQALAGLGKAMFSGIGRLFSWLGGLGDKIGGPLGAVIKILAFPLKVIGQIASRISEVFGGVGTMLNGLFNLDFAMVWDGIKQVLGGIGGFLWDVLKNVFYEIPKLLGGLLKAVFWDLPKVLGGMLLTGLKAILWDFPKWLLGVLVDGLKGLGELIMTGLKTVFVDLPKRFGEAVYAGIDWVTERFKEAWNWVTELPTRIWEGIKEAFTKLKDWVLSWIPGAKGAVEGFQEKADETQKRIEEAGGGITGRVKAAEFSKGVGRTVGGAKDLITGGGEGRWEGAKKMVSGAAEATVGAVKGVVGGAVSIAKKLNPFSWFQEGTREITKTGLAVVHEGEGIIPTPIWNSIAAVGSGAFPMNEGQGVLQSISPSGLAKGASQAVSSGLQSVGDALENVPLIGKWLRKPADMMKGVVDTVRKKGVMGTLSEGVKQFGKSVQNVPVIGKALKKNADMLSAGLGAVEEKGLFGVLKDALGFKSASTPTATPEDKGAFEAGEGKSAISEALSNGLKALTDSSPLQTAASAITGPLFGLFERFFGRRQKPSTLDKQATEAAQTTADTMEMGQRRGSIFVHDIHVEAVLLQLGKALLKAINEKVKLQHVSTQQLGAFNSDQASEAIGEAQIQLVSHEVPPKTALEKGQYEVTRRETRQQGVVTSAQETGSPTDYAALAQHHRRAAEAFKHQTFDPKTASYLSIKAAEGRSRLVEGLTGATNVPLLSESDHHKLLAEHYEKRAAELGARREITPQNLGAYDPGSVREASGGVLDQRVADTRAMVPATPENELRNTQGITRSETRQRGVVTSSKETGSPADYAALAQHHRRAAEAFKHQTFDPKTASYLSIKAAEGRSRLVEGLTGATNVPLLSESDHHKMLAEHYEKRAAELGARQIAPQNLGAYDPGSVREASGGVIDQRVADVKDSLAVPGIKVTLPVGGSYVQDTPTLNGQTLPGAESKLTPLTATTDLVDATERYREQLVTDAQKLMDAQRQGAAWEASYTPLGALDSRTTLPDAMSVQPMITQMEGVQPPTDVGRLTRELSGMRPGTGLYDQGDNERLAEAFQTFRSLETQRIEDAQIPMRAADESSNALEAAKVLAEPGTGTQYGKAPSEAAEKALQEKMKVEREQTEGYYEYLKRIADKGAFGAKGVEFHTKAEPGTALNYEQAASRAAEGLIMKTEAFEVDMSSLKQAQEMPEPPTPTISVGDGMIYDRAASEAADDIVAKFSSVMPETADKQDVIASVGKALEYERSASEAAENNIVSKLTNMMPADSTEKDDVVAAVGKALDYERAGSRAAEQTSTDAALIALSQKEIVPERQNIVADLSRSLDYDRAGSDAATRNLSVGTGREMGSETASPNMIDYTDSLRPMVEPLMVSRTGIEERLEQDRYGEQPSNAGMLPSMDEIADYLTTMQFEKLSEMVALLTEIKNRMSPTSSPRVIGAQGGGTRPMNRPGVKNIAQDLTRGRWDLTFNEFSVSGVSDEGRGGSA